MHVARLDGWARPATLAASCPNPGRRGLSGRTAWCRVGRGTTRMNRCVTARSRRGATRATSSRGQLVGAASSDAESLPARRIEHQHPIGTAPRRRRPGSATTVGQRGRKHASVGLISLIGNHRSDGPGRRPASAGAARNGEQPLARAASSCSSTAPSSCPITLRFAVGFVRPECRRVRRRTPATDGAKRHDVDPRAPSWSWRRLSRRTPSTADGRPQPRYGRGFLLADVGGSSRAAAPGRRSATARARRSGGLCESSRQRRRGASMSSHG